MQQHERVAIFWDCESCPPSSTLNGYQISNNIRSLAHTFGSVTQFKAYLTLFSPDSSARFSILRSQLHASGVSLILCPSDGRNVSNRNMMMVDMIAYAMDHSAPATLVVISNHRDYAYSISILRLRKYRVVVVCASSAHASLTAQASVHLDWNRDVLGEGTPVDSPVETRPLSTPSRRRSSSTSAIPLFPPTPATSRMVAAEEDDDGDDPDDPNDRVMCFAPHDGRKKNTYNPCINGFVGEQPSKYALDISSGRQSPAARSWTAPKTYSPFAPSRSAKTSPPSVERSAEPLAASSQIHGLYSTLNSKPSLPKGFPIHEPEPITLKPAAEDAGQVSSWLTRNASQTPLDQPKQPEVPTTPGFALVSPPSFVIPPTRSASSGPVIPPSAGAKNLSPIPETTAVPPLPKPASTAPSPAPTPLPFPTTIAITIPPIAPKSPAVLPAVPPRPASSTSQAPSSPPKPAHPSALASTLSAPGPPLLPAALSKVIPVHFTALVDALEARRRSYGQIRVPRTEVGSDLAKVKTVYRQAGVTKFAAYIDMAQKARIVDLGGEGNDQWVMLCPEWSSPPL